MCGRFTLTLDPNELRQAFSWLKVENPAEIIANKLLPRYNIAPSQKVPVVTNEGGNTLEFFHWGLVPSWAKDPEIGNRLINARSETLEEKPAFRAAYRRRRCLILANGFYEWQLNPDGKTKTPKFIYLPSHQPFAFAGLWEVCSLPDRPELRSCTIITTSPNAEMSAVHQRMPVILPPQAYETWLTPGERNPKELQPLLVPLPGGSLQMHSVERLVNSPNNDRFECIQPIPSSQELFHP